MTASSIFFKLAECKESGVDIDTNHLLGNHAPYASMQAVDAKGEHSESIDFPKIIPKSPLNAGGRNYFQVEAEISWNHLNLNIYPDSGVACLRLFGHLSTE